MTSSAIRPASRPTRVGSSVTVPKKRRTAGSGSAWPPLSFEGAPSTVVVPPPAPRQASPGTVTARLGRLGIELPAGDVRLHKKPGAVRGDGHVLSGPEPSIAPGRLIEAVGVARRTPTSRSAAQAALNGAEQHVRSRKARQIDVRREVVDQLANRHAPLRPERHVVEMLPEDRRPQRRDEELFAPQLLAGADGERIARQKDASPERSPAPADSPGPAPAATGRSLESARAPCDSAAFSCVSACPRWCLPRSRHVGLVNDRLPRQVSANRLVEVLHPRLVGREEHQAVAEEARTVAARFQQRLRGDLRGARAVLRVRVFRRQHDQAAHPGRPARLPRSAQRRGRGRSRPPCAHRRGCARRARRRPCPARASTARRDLRRAW